MGLGGHVRFLGMGTVRVHWLMRDYCGFWGKADLAGGVSLKGLLFQ